MTVTVHYFASLADRTGVASETIELSGSADVEALWDAVCARHARLAELDYRPMAACDMEYADWDRRLDGVGEVAFLPPVSGG